MGVEVLGQCLLIHLGGIELAVGDVLRQPLRGTRDLIPAAVIQRDRQLDTVIVSGFGLQPVHQVDQFTVQLHPVADEPDARIAFIQFAGFLGDIEPEEAHQPGHLDLGPFPVLGRKGENRQVLDPDILAGLDHFADAFRAGMVTEKPRPPAGLRPAAIAVHDDRDMLGRARDQLEMLLRARGVVQNVFRRDPALRHA